MLYNIYNYITFYSVYIMYLAQFLAPTRYLLYVSVITIIITITISSILTEGAIIIEFNWPLVGVI